MLGNYFGMLWESHLLVKSSCSFDASRQLLCSDFTWLSGLVTIRWSKTIHFHEWVVLLPLPFIPASPLCPVMAVERVIPGVVLLPLPFMPDSPLSPVTAVKRVMPGVVLLPCHLYQTPSFALLRQLKGLSLGWFFFPCHLHQTAHLCPVMAVKRVIPGVVLLPLPFIPDSPPLPFYGS